MVLTGCIVLLQVAGHLSFAVGSDGKWSVQYDRPRKLHSMTCFPKLSIAWRLMGWSADRCMPDELNNPLLSPALQVLLGAITIEEAITHVRESAELAAMSDADLETVLAEARNNLEERVPSGSDLVCIELMLTAIHRRLEAIVGGRKTATPETRPTYDHGWRNGLPTPLTASC